MKNTRRQKKRTQTCIHAEMPFWFRHFPTILSILILMNFLIQPILLFVLIWFSVIHDQPVFYGLFFTMIISRIIFLIPSYPALPFHTKNHGVGWNSNPIPQSSIFLFHLGIGLLPLILFHKGPKVSDGVKWSLRCLFTILVLFDLFMLACQARP